MSRNATGQSALPSGLVLVLRQVSEHGPLTLHELGLKLWSPAHQAQQSVRAKVNELRSRQYVRLYKPGRTRTMLVEITETGCAYLTAPPKPLVCGVAEPRSHLRHGQYTGSDLAPFSGRPGAMHAFSLPSLRNGERRPTPRAVQHGRRALGAGRMNLTEANKALWLWLHSRGGYWTAQEVAQRTGYSSQNIFRALHAMARRHLIEQVDPAAGQHRKRYGVTEQCLIPLGLRVGEIVGEHDEGERPAKRESETGDPLAMPRSRTTRYIPAQSRQLAHSGEWQCGFNDTSKAAKSTTRRA